MRTNSGLQSYCYIFCKREDVPSPRELLLTLEQHGVVLWVHPESFADEGEAERFDYDDPAWRVLVLGTPDETIVMSLWAYSNEDAYFYATIEGFWDEVLPIGNTPGKQHVQHYLGEANFVIELLLETQDTEIWPLQTIVMDYFNALCDGITYLEFDMAFVARVGEYASILEM